MNYTAKDWQTPPPPPGPQERVQRHTMEQLADVAPMVPSLAVPEPQMVDQLVAMVKHVDSVVPEQIIAVPKISWPSRFPRTGLCEPQKAEQLVEVPVPAPSFSDWVRWEETYRRTGHTWLGGFDWCYTASPGRYINTGPGPRRRSWYRAASARQSGEGLYSRLSRQLDTVQSVQFWGVRGRTAATSSSSSSSVVDVPVIMQRRRSWLCNTWFDCGYIFLRQFQRDFWKNFAQFLRDWVDSGSCGRFSSCRGSGRARRQQWQWLVLTHLALCSRRLPACRHAHGEKCAQ